MTQQGEIECTARATTSVYKPAEAKSRLSVPYVCVF